MLRKFIILLVLGFSQVGIIQGQNNKILSITTPGEGTKGVLKLYKTNDIEPPRALEFKDGEIKTEYLKQHLNEYLGINPKISFQEVESTSDALGMQHQFLKPYYGGLEIEGLGYRIHSRKGFVKSVNGKGIQELNLNLQPTLTEQQAFENARRILNSTDTTRLIGKKLIVSKDFTYQPGSFMVAYQFEIPVTFTDQWRISIDANTGQLINKVNLTNSCFSEKPPIPYVTGMGRTRYNGNQKIRIESVWDGYYQLKGMTENGGIIETSDFNNVTILAFIFGFYSTSPFYSTDTLYNFNDETAAVSAHWAAEQAFEYYFKVHGRNSYDNAGSTITSIVRIDVNMNNAFWSGYYKVLGFGDGSNNNPYVELDVVGHELTHGVVEYEANLAYFNESGALNESFADIFGQSIEFHSLGESINWQIGGHIIDGGIRDMSNPNKKNQPDTYMGNLWYDGIDDNGGVHINSGVQNFWFYLLSNGGSGINDYGLSYSIEPIGVNTASKIAYRNLTEYLSYTSDFLDARIGSLLATEDLYGRNSAIYSEVDQAWDAVGVIDEPIITKLELYDITGTTAKISGELSPRGDSVSYYFEYGPTPAYGSKTMTYHYNGEVIGILKGLTSSTKYFLRLIATNENGSTFFTTEFTTISLEPLIRINSTADITETSANLKGDINPNSLVTSYYFEYGLTPALGMFTPTKLTTDTTEFIEVSIQIQNLIPRQTYYYQLVAYNNYKSVKSSVLKLFTANSPIITSFTPESGIVGATITLTGRNFNPILDQNNVFFGATKGRVISASESELKVVVPGGASMGTINVQDKESGLIAESINDFIPTFNEGFKPKDLQLRVGIDDYIWQAYVQDMDGDGKPDIITNSYGNFSVYQNIRQDDNLTNESFIRSTFPLYNYFKSLFLVDLDGNGLKDIVGFFWQTNDKGYYTGSLRIYPNLSVPGYIFFGTPLDLESTKYMRNFVFGDFNLDGRIDIAGDLRINQESDSSQLIMLRNENIVGQLSDQNFRMHKLIKSDKYIAEIIADDFNKDGKPDLRVSHPGDSNSVIYMNNSTREFYSFDEKLINGWKPTSLYTGFTQDINQDNKKEYISNLANQDYRLVAQTFNSTTTDISLSEQVLIFNDEIRNTRPGDINGDGKVDLIGFKNEVGGMILLNNTIEGSQLSDSTFGKPIRFSKVKYAKKFIINDLNGDGRPEIIVVNEVNSLAHEGSNLEIWQNSPYDCNDPAMVTVQPEYDHAIIQLPPNTTFDQFEFEIKYYYGSYSKVNSLRIDLYPGQTYTLRTRAKCYSDYTEYSFLTFATKCTRETIAIGTIGINSVTLISNDPWNFLIEYSEHNKNEWLSPYGSQILNLQPGTQYDLRARYNCPTSEFEYFQFTTKCASITQITITQTSTDEAIISYTSNYPDIPTFEFSADNISWTPVDGVVLKKITPGVRFYLRGKMPCSSGNSDVYTNFFVLDCPSASDVQVSNISPFMADISWSYSLNLNEYIVRLQNRSKNEDDKFFRVNSKSYLLTDLVPGNRYKIGIAPVCEGNIRFVEIEFTTPCFEPSGISVENLGQTTARIFWNDDYTFNYTIDYSISGSNDWQKNLTQSNSIQLDQLRPGTVYVARVHVGCTTPTPYNLIFETNLYSETTLAPNPTTGIVTIQPSRNLIGSPFRILDSMGREIKSGTLESYTFEFSQLTNGLYTLQIAGEKDFRIIKE